MMPSPRYDYIFTGTGAAALSLALRIKRSPRLQQKKILLIDRSEKKSNDRTWSFWEKGQGFFEDIVYKSWEQLTFVSENNPLSLTIAPYRYKMIRGIDFYQHCLNQLLSFPDVHFVQGQVNGISPSEPSQKMTFNGDILNTDGSIIFNSIFDENHRMDNECYLLQHFKGWIIETDEPVFDPGKAVLMDFSVPQTHGTTFAYILPFSENTALVEYTLFTASLLDDDSYEEGLTEYLKRYLKGVSYRIREKEFGVIPMTDRRFPSVQGNIFHIGTAGGQTKASTGYTFQFIQKQSGRILHALETGKPFQTISPSPARYRFYDGILLELLAKGSPPGRQIFSTLFARNRASDIFRFLDNETSIWQDLRLISTLPFYPFLRCAVARMFR
jgi:lycopene beta-cyclase